MCYKRVKYHYLSDNNQTNRVHSAGGSGLILKLKEIVMAEKALYALMICERPIFYSFLLVRNAFLQLFRRTVKGASRS